MWHQDLLHKLIWKTPTITGLETYCVPPGMDEPYQAPSWSWTSIDCPIIVKYRSFRSPHDCLALVGTGGILAGAYLRITGTMYNAQLHYVGFSGRIWPDLSIGLLSKTQTRLKGSFAGFYRRAMHRWRQASINIRLRPIKSTMVCRKSHSSAWLVMLTLVPTGEPDEHQLFVIVEVRSN